MDTIKRISLAHVLAVATLVIVMGLALEASAYKSKINRKNSVSVDVKPVQLAPGQTVKFEVRMTTHSVELDQDIVASSTLKDNNGREYRPVGWNGSPPGGHHRKGVLEFPALEGEPKAVTLVIRDISNVPERIFAWDVER